MNFFFGFKNTLLESRLTIPRFRNFGHLDKNYNLYYAEPINNKWNYSKIETKLNDDDFYYINKELIENNRIFFLSKKRRIKI